MRKGVNEKPNKPNKPIKNLSKLKIHIKKIKLISFFSPTHLNKTNQYIQVIKFKFPFHYYFNNNQVQFKMQLRSGRSVDASSSTKSSHTMAMRRNSRNHEEFEERTRYQAEQKAIESGIYTSEVEITASKKKHIYNTMKHLIYAINYQKTNKRPLHEMVDTCLELYTFINNNLQEIIDNNIFPKKLATVVVEKGHYIINEIYRRDRTRGQKEKFNDCRNFIENVIDIIEHHILKLF